MDLMVKSMLDLRQLESFSLQEPSSSTTTPSLHPRRSQPAVPSREPLGLGSTTSLHIPPTAWVRPPVLPSLTLYLHGPMSINAYLMRCYIV